MLVVDASVTVAACYAESGFRHFKRQKLFAPPLMWSEARSVIRLAVHRRGISESDGELAFDALESCPVKQVDHAKLGRTAWGVAKQLGWARTYDAEFVALAQILGCRLVTLDERLIRGANRLNLVVHPLDI